MESSLVSVIMVARNASSTIKEAIRSVLSQTYEELELLVVDDCSEDRTLDEVRNFTDARVRVIRNLAPRGQPLSRNHAVSLSSGHWVTMLDADDVMLPNRLALQVFFARRVSGPLILGTWAQRFGDGQGLLTPPIGLSGVRARAFFSSPMVHSTLFTRRELMSGLEYSADFPQVADYDLIQRALAQGVRITNLPVVLGRYRVHSGQVSALRSEAGQRFMSVVHSRLLESLGIMVTEEDLRIHLALALRVQPGESPVSRSQVESWSARVLAEAQRQDLGLSRSLRLEFFRRERQLFRLSR